jgi:tetratricopeptide (TPR) repeat protein
LAGYGPETFTAAFPAYQSAELARAYPDFAYESPHNIFLDSLTAQGVLGVILLAGLCAVAFRAAWRARGKHSATAPALAAALAAGIVSQQFTVFTIPTATILFATIGLAVGLEPQDDLVRRRSIAWIVAGVPLIYLAIRFAAADHALALAQRSLAAGDVASAAGHYHSAQIPGASSDLWYSRALLRAGALQQATLAGASATRTAEDPFNAWYSLSSLYAAQNDVPRAEASLRAAIAASPTWFKPHWTLARLLELTGRSQEAAREAARAVDLDGGKHAEVAATLQQIRARLQE